MNKGDRKIVHISRKFHIRLVKIIENIKNYIKVWEVSYNISGDVVRSTLFEHLGQ